MISRTQPFLKFFAVALFELTKQEGHTMATVAFTRCLFLVVLFASSNSFALIYRQPRISGCVRRGEGSFGGLAAENDGFFGKLASAFAADKTLKPREVENKVRARCVQYVLYCNEEQRSRSETND